MATGFKELVKVGAVHVCPVDPLLDTVKITVAVVEADKPEPQLAVIIVFIGKAPVIVGVPEITLVLALKDKPVCNVDVPILKETVDVAVELAKN